MNRAEVLLAYDEQLRWSLQPPSPQWTVERAGVVLRIVPPEPGGWAGVVASDLDAATADAVIQEQVAFFAAAGQEFEWKWHGYDEPADLPERLLAAGFEPAEEESLVVGEVQEVLASCAAEVPPPGVAFRRIGAATADADFAGIGALKTAVWGDDGSSLVRWVRQEWEAHPERMIVHVADVDGQVVSAAWVRFHPGTMFASLWGGSTLPQWRRRGIYRHLVARRASEANERGFRYLQVDASDASLPILQGLGLQKLTATTPYMWRPPATTPVDRPLLIPEDRDKR